MQEHAETLKMPSGTASLDRVPPDRENRQILKNDNYTIFAELLVLRGLAVDKGGLVYVADTRKNTIRRINPVMNTSPLSEKFTLCSQS